MMFTKDQIDRAIGRAMDGITRDSVEAEQAVLADSTNFMPLVQLANEVDYIENLKDPVHQAASNMYCGITIGLALTQIIEEDARGAE